MDEDDILKVLDTMFTRKVFKRLAVAMKAYYDELMAIGFTKEQAMQLLCSTKMGLNKE